MSKQRVWRYIAPNVITTFNIVFGVLALLAIVEGRYADAGWWIIYAVLCDRLDGLVARFVRGTSALGGQLDSLADFLNFGVAPPALMFASLGASPALPFATGAGRVVLVAACVTWVLGAALRLARFNVSAADAPRGIFFGVPTTLAAGALIMWYLALLKYAPAGSAISVERFGGARLLTSFESPDVVWRYLPLALFAGGALMVSSLRMPKLGRTASRWFTAFVLANVALGYVLCSARLFPELLIWQPTAWIVVFLIWGQISERARAMKPPPWFSERREAVLPPPEDELFLDEIQAAPGADPLDEDPLSTRQR